MIAASELNPENIPLGGELLSNFETLLAKLNFLAGVYGKPMRINRGVSTEEDQARIDPAHPRDAHVKAAGADIADDTHELREWCVANMPLIEKLDLYLESFASTPRHVHVQIYPPKSGRRIFIP